MVVVDDAGEPLDGHLAVHVGGFYLAGEEKIAVVVVADVLLVEPGEVRHAALEGIFFAHVPVGDEFLAVGVGQDAEDDVVVEDTESFGVVAADELVDGLHKLLGADGFGGVEATVDPDYGFAGLGEVMGLSFGDALGQSEAAGDVFVLLEVLLVLGRRDDRHVVSSAFCGFADIDQFHAVGFGGQFLPVRFELGVVGDAVVVADVKPQGFLRAGDFFLGESRKYEKTQS